MYEKKLTSYPRTDCTVIGNPEFAYLKAYLADYLRLLDISIKEPQLTANKRYVDSSKVQEHYAIIPTRTTLKDWKTLSKKEQSIYTLILKRTVSIFEKPYQYEETTIVTTVHAIDFHSTGKIEIEKGWKAILTTPSEEKDYLLPAIQKDDTVQSLFEQKEGHTQPPKYYTEGTLLSAMKNVGRSLDDVSKNILKETAGIGTEATRASIIENLKQKKYISIQSKKILVTNKGKLLCDMIKDDEIANAEMTAKWETYLKKIRENKGSQKAFLNSIQKFVTHLIQKVPDKIQASPIDKTVKQITEASSIGNCPLCDGKIVDKGKIYGCTGYQSGCRFSLPKKWSGKTLSKRSLAELLDKQQTSLIKGFKSKKGKSFSARLKLEKQKLVFVFEERQRKG